MKAEKLSQANKSPALIAKGLLKLFQQGLSRYAKALALLSGVAFTLVIQITIAPTLTRGDSIPIDADWLIGMAAQMQQGEILGRDVFLTYGPLTQLLAYAGTLFNPEHNAFNSYGMMFLILMTLGSICLAILLAFARRINWQLSLCIFLISTVMGLLLYYNRSWLLVVVAVGLGRALSAKTTRWQLIGAGLVGAGCFLLQLFAFDSGLYSLAAVMMVLVAYSFLARFPNILKKPDLISFKNGLLMLAIALGTYILGNLLFSLGCLLTSPNYPGLLEYQIRSWEQAKAYTFAFATPWQIDWVTTLAVGLLILYTTFSLIWQLPKIATSDGYLLVSILGMALVSLKGATTRSDYGHLILSCIPFLALFFLLAVDWRRPTEKEASENVLRKGSFRVRLGWVGVFLFLLASWPGVGLGPLQNWLSIFEGQLSVRTRLGELANSNSPLNAIVSDRMKAGLDPTKTILAFPYQNHIPIVLKQKLIAPFAGTYVAHSESAQRWYIGQLERHKAEIEVVYGLDELASLKIDRVQQPTRVPIIFEYLYRNFEIKNDRIIKPGYIILKPTPQPRQDMTSTELKFTSVVEPNSAQTLQIAEPTSCSMLRLTPKISYSFLASIGRPTSFELRVRRGQAEIQFTALMPLEVGQPFSTFVQLVDNDKTSQIFGTKPVQQKVWDNIQIGLRPSTLFDVGPSSTEILKLECINFQR